MDCMFNYCSLDETSGLPSLESNEGELISLVYLLCYLWVTGSHGKLGIGYN